MNIEHYILNQLQREGHSAIPGLGTFSLIKSSASFDPESSVFLPPANKIAFRTGTEAENKPSPFDDKFEDEIAAWKNNFHENKPFSIEGIGSFILEDDQLVFEGHRLNDFNSDFYGLGEVRIQPAEKAHIKKSIASPTNNSGGTTWLWVTVVLIPILGIAYLAYAHPETLFGKKSFQEPKQPIVEKPQSVKDSLKQDSINVISTPVDSSTISKPNP